MAQRVRVDLAALLVEEAVALVEGRLLVQVLEADVPGRPLDGHGNPGVKTTLSRAVYRLNTYYKHILIAQHYFLFNNPKR